MAHSVGDVCQISLVHSCLNQVILNIYHVRVASSQSVASDVSDNQDLADHTATMYQAGGVLADLMAIMPGNTTLVTIRAQKVYPGRSTYAEASVNRAGGAVAAVHAPNLQACISKRGSKGTRRAQGAMHIGPLGNTHQNLGFLETTFRTGLVQWANIWKNPYTVPDNLIQYVPIIYNPGQVPPWDTILAVSVKDTVRTMRRRTVGLGI